MIWKFVKKIIQKGKYKTKNALSPFQINKKKEKLKIINNFKNKFEELLRIQVYEPVIINQLVREFLSHLYDIKIGFTPSEFKQKVHINKIKEDTKRRLIIFLETLDDLRYNNKILSVEKTKTLMEDFLLILKELKD
ncbi:hypothetical protein J4418_03845 [Candidatus Woesearchaeota archaeon]|nr:hypothetical protein [Candidatus Woesearchaeota archaeon]